MRAECKTVWTKSPASTPKLASNAWPISVGAGKSTCGTSKACVSTCQNTSTHTPNNKGVPSFPSQAFSSRAASQRTLNTATTSMASSAAVNTPVLTVCPPA